jgi:hypothetical protein
MTDANGRRAGLARRTLMKQLGLAAGCAAALPAVRALADSPARLDVKDPAAIALGYVENAAGVDLKKYPDYIKGSNCENCLQLQGTAGDNYRPCTAFPGKLVSVSGWCKVWTPEM